MKAKQCITQGTQGSSASEPARILHHSQTPANNDMKANTNETSTQWKQIREAPKKICKVKILQLHLMQKEKEKVLEKKQEKEKVNRHHHFPREGQIPETSEISEKIQNKEMSKAHQNF